MVEVNDDFGITHQLQQNYTINYEGHLLHAYFLLDDNKEPVAVTTSTSLSAFVIGLIVFTETGKYKFLAILPLLIPLYTRIQKEDVLDQFVRGQIYGYIKTNPGVHYNQIRRGMGVKNGTLSYHLSVLEKTELIKSRREGLKYRAFYPTGMKFPQNERFRLTELQINILNIIKKQNGINQKEIAKKLHKKPQTINYNIKILKQADIIEVVKKGRKTLCYPKDEYEYQSSPAQ
jgi:predicted transcriptional regulator